MARLPSFITRHETSRGVRYEARINTTLSTGARLQHRKRFVSLDAAKAWHAATAAALASGTFTEPSSLTVHAAVKAWLAAKSARVKVTTAEAYTAALQPVVDAYGTVPVQKITKHDVEQLVTALRTGTTERGVWKRTSINPMLARWRSVWADLHAQGILARNVVALVEPLRKPSGEPAMKVDDSLSEAEVETLCAAVAGGPRDAFVNLALLGLRRGELAGLRWEAIGLDSEVPMLTIRETRLNTGAGVICQDGTKTVAGGRVLHLPPHVGTKTVAGGRVLHLPPHVTPILQRTRGHHRELRRRLGGQWQGPADGDGYVFIGDLGKPLAPCTLDTWWARCLAAAGLPHRRLHASRHSAASLLAIRGAGVPLIAAWLGHADGGVLAMRSYVHTPGAALTATAALLSRKPVEEIGE